MCGTTARTSSGWSARASWRRAKGATATAIALAYVLAQPFPTFALIGPQTIAEMGTSVAALGVTLTPDEVRWLAAGA